MSPADEAREAATPSAAQQEKMGVVARTVIESVGREAAKHGALDVVLGGSYAKGTWLADGADIDVFVLFEADLSKDELREKSKAVGFSALADHEPYTRYAEHPFVEATVDGIKVNVVPCYDVQAGMWKSAADRSRFHTEHVRGALDERGRADARVLKKFLKANGVYGAEISKQGFSGYASEVLVLELGSFERVLEKFANIERGSIIGKAEKEFDTPVAIIDPVDGCRNLAAAISQENMARFVMAARSYLKEPTAKFFESAQASPADALGQVVAIRFSYEHRSPETVWGQAKRAASQVAGKMSDAGFVVARHTAVVDGSQVILAFMLESMQVSRRRVREGPDAFSREDSAKFVSERLPGSEIMWVGRDARLYSMEEREQIDAETFLTELMRRKGSGIPTGLADDVAGGFETWTGGRIPGPVKEMLTGFASIDDRIFRAR